MNTSLKLGFASLAVLATAAAGSAQTIAHAQAPAVVAKPAAVTAQQPNCAGESAFRIEVDRPRDLQVSMWRAAGASSWSTMLVATGRVATLDHSRSCGATNRVQVTADESDARSALQTCAIIGASVGAGQKLVLSLRHAEGARVGAGGSILTSKPLQIDCNIE